MNENKTPGTRIREIREMKFWSLRKLSEKSGVSVSKLSRIENGELQTISSDTLIALVPVLEISADYILGLTDIKNRCNMDVAATGLSEEAVRRMTARRFDMEVLNRLLEHDSFPMLTKSIRMYFSDIQKYGVESRNQVLNFGIGCLDSVSVPPEERAELRHMKAFLKSQELGAHEIDIEKIKKHFLHILADIKKEIDENQPTTPPIQMDTVKSIIEGTPIQPTELPSIEMIQQSMIAGIQQQMNMSEKSQELIKALFASVVQDSQNVIAEKSEAEE